MMVKGVHVVLIVVCGDVKSIQSPELHFYDGAEVTK